ncbi:hypothetical protein AGMMS49525_10290 [Bacteroidia bacterium]|nr:hypothetical protein AGMMS49525_10290 [Bacteroidia bacterium]
MENKKKVGRKPVRENAKQVTFRISEKTILEIKRVAKKLLISQNDLIERTFVPQVE